MRQDGRPPVARRTRLLWAAGILVVLLLVAAAWRYTGLRDWFDVDEIAAAVAPYRTSWFSFPLSLLVFVVLELLVFPVVVLVFACGIVFGPWLGAAHALVGSVGSALVPFAIGRWLGRDAVVRHGGGLARRIEKVLERRGVIAVFLVRKIPAPFTLVNIVCGASTVSWRDFVVGTLLGMGTGVILLTVLGGQLFEVARSPDPWSIALGIAFLFVPLLLALVLQRWINRQKPRQDEQEH